MIRFIKEQTNEFDRGFGADEVVDDDVQPNKFEPGTGGGANQFDIVGTTTLFQAVGDLALHPVVWSTHRTEATHSDVAVTVSGLIETGYTVSGLNPDLDCSAEGVGEVECSTIGFEISTPGGHCETCAKGIHTGTLNNETVTTESNSGCIDVKGPYAPKLRKNRRR